jgi:hypothetical protein
MWVNRPRLFHTRAITHQMIPMSDQRVTTLLLRSTCFVLIRKSHLPGTASNGHSSFTLRHGRISSEISFDHLGHTAHLVWQTIGDNLPLIKHNNPI